MKKWIIAIAWAWSVVLAASASAERFVFEAGNETTQVRFDSKATIESFHGDTNQARGHVIFSPTALTDSIDVWVEVDMATLDTGINKRNDDMRENHLHTDRFPTATFKGARLAGDAPPSLTVGEPITLQVEGTFTLHGISKPLTLPVQVTLREPAAIHVVAEFMVSLEAFDIPRPKFLFMKLAEEQRATIDVVASLVPEALEAR